MFTGIVTDLGEIVEREQRGDLRLRIRTGYDLGTVAMGASIACSGVCLTVVDKGDDWFAVDVSAETLSRTARAMWDQGAHLNLERALRVGEELGGHIVTGHVDGVGKVVSVSPEGDSTRIAVQIPGDLAPAVAAKGSITLDGVSLTVNSVDDGHQGTVLTVNIIPHTAAQTTLGGLTEGRQLNVEIDVLARYLERMLKARAQ
jgi:riboflavin synthase